jgi:hypothetical protein
MLTMKPSPLVPTFAPLVLAAASLPLRADLLAYYPFDADFHDASGNNNHLTIAEGEPSIIQSEGDFIFGGGALDTDSTIADREFLELTNPITFAAEDAWTIAFWARRRAGSDNRQGMVVGDVNNPTDFVWLSDNPSQVQGLRFRSSDNTNFNFEIGADDAQWHHWALVTDGTGHLSLYRDNTFVGTETSTTTFSLRNVAQAYNSNVHSMNGQIDELYLYNEALDEATIASLFLGTAASELRITNLDLSTLGTAVVTWDSSPGDTYELKYSRDLQEWSSFDGGSVEASEDTTTLTVDLTAIGADTDARLFFRVVKP